MFDGLIRIDAETARYLIRDGGDEVGYIIYWHLGVSWMLTVNDDEYTEDYAKSFMSYRGEV